MHDHSFPLDSLHWNVTLPSTDIYPMSAHLPNSFNRDLCPSKTNTIESNTHMCTFQRISTNHELQSWKYSCRIDWKCKITNWTDTFDIKRVNLSFENRMTYFLCHMVLACHNLKTSNQSHLWFGKVSMLTSIAIYLCTTHCCSRCWWTQFH